MELDELKQLWKGNESTKYINKSIMEMIQHKSYGPIAALKREFRKQMVVMTILPLLLLLTSSDDITKALGSILFWAYTIFCVSIILFAYRNYRIVDKLSVMDGVVKTTVEQHVQLLQQRIQRLFIGLRIALISLIVLTEVVPYIQHYSMLDKWHSVSPLIRYASYTALLAFQYFIGRKILYRKFGSHLAYLQNLLQDLRG